MRASKLWAIVAPALLLLSQQLSSPLAAHADAYQLIALANDAGLYFSGMDNSGNVVFSVFSVNQNQCPDYASNCYKTMNAGTSTLSTTLPNLDWDYTSGTCTYFSPSSCSITNHSRTATISSNPSGEENLSVTSGSNPSQTLLTTGFGGIFAINGLGDIVYDNGLDDEWYEAINLSPLPTEATFSEAAYITTPEPATFLLLATGILGGMFFLRRRRTTPASL